MTIQIKAYRIIDGKISSPPIKIDEFPNDHNFGFDIMNQDNWKMFLIKYYSDVKDHHGFKLAFRVHTNGTSKDMFGNEHLPPSYYCPTKKRGKNYALNPYIVFFPVDEEYKKVSLMKYGRIN